MATEIVKPTPGEWKVAHSGYANTPFVIYAGDRAPNFESKFPLSGVNVIAEVFQDESPSHLEQAANVRLILAAPKLLDALESLVIADEEQVRVPKWIEEARAAIRKARGNDSEKSSEVSTGA
jgi:hypothetical protein